MNKLLRSPKATVVLFVLAAVLLGFGGINAIQAAPRIESADYRAQVQLSNINVAVTEGGEVKGGDEKLLTNLTGGAQFQIGQTYKEVLAVQNTAHPGSDNKGEGIDEYVRVTVYCYWTQKDGNNKNKRVDLDPSLIDLHFLEGNGWFIDQEASKGSERTVLYYKDILKPGESTTPFTDTLTIKNEVATAISNADYAYQDLDFNVKVTADAVQTHNGEEAMTSAWGRTNAE